MVFSDPDGQIAILQNAADNLADFRNQRIQNAGCFQDISSSSLAGRTVGVLGGFGTGLLAGGAGLLEFATRGCVL